MKIINNIKKNNRLSNCITIVLRTFKNNMLIIIFYNFICVSKYCFFDTYKTGLTNG